VLRRARVSRLLCPNARHPADSERRYRNATISVVKAIPAARSRSSDPSARAGAGSADRRRQCCICSAHPHGVLVSILSAIYASLVMGNAPSMAGLTKEVRGADDHGGAATTRDGSATPSVG
jgi:hypothetical protein